jgi:uncharacterized protein (TIGR02271 family)
MHGDDTLSLDRLTPLAGANVYDVAGERIGSVEEIFYDDETSRPEWIGVGTGFLGTRRILVPVAGARASGDGITVPYAKDTVNDAPDVDGDRISEDVEVQLYTYYRTSWTDRWSGDRAVADDGRATAPRDGRSDSMTRSEEQLRVGKETIDAGRVRLRKWVETEPVQADVELERETAHVRRERIDEPTTAAAIGEQEIDVVLHEERPVVAKETVARERIRLDRGLEVETTTVRDDVRREHVDVEGDPALDGDRRARGV